MEIMHSPYIQSPEKKIFISSLFGGAAAGLTVDTVLFPLDTLKTRLQSAQGFIKAGGFHSVYKGLGPQLIGSAPQAALFFVTYDLFKHKVEPIVTVQYLPFVHMMGGAIGETVSCLVRVPMEVVKQRRQTTSESSLAIFLNAYRTEGPIRGLYRGFSSTVCREVPFAFIQFPVFEFLKLKYRSHLKQNNSNLDSWEVALCGAVAGGFAAVLTTPLDVAKTRIILAPKSQNRINTNLVSVLKMVWKEKGVRGLFAGVGPRSVWISIGGCIFFGVYDRAKRFCNDRILN